MITRERIIGNIEMMKAMQADYKQRLRSLPQGKIYYKIQHNKARPYRRINGKEQYLASSKAKLIEGLSNRLEIERALEILERNISLLEDIVESYCDPEELIPACLELCLLNGEREIKTSQEVASQIDRWYQAKAGHPGHKDGINIASDGTLLKSRAELIAYEFLKQRGVEFKYEHPVMIDGQMWYPDFMIIRKKDNAVFLWEHFGMMDIEKYRKQAERKLYKYAAEGYFPYKNLILTYDFGDDSVDLIWVTKLMKIFEIL